MVSNRNLPFELLRLELIGFISTGFKFNPQSIYDIDDCISFVQRKLWTSPPFHNPRCPTCAQELARLHSLRYGLSGQKGDLDKSILYSTQAILAAPARIKPRGNIVHLFFSLTFELFRRSQEFNQPSDIKACIKCLNFSETSRSKSSISCGISIRWRSCPAILTRAFC